MKNFYLRLGSSLVMGPVFLAGLYEVGFFFYSLLFLILLTSFYEVFKNVKQFFLSFALYFLILFFIFSLFNIRGSNNNDYIILVWLISIVWTSDIGGYVFGKVFKGPKLTNYSPNKTISGLIGSIIFSQVSFLILYLFLDYNHLTLKLFILQFFLCIIAVCGDIFFSYIKRTNQIKDYSNLIPGHGGILDRIDGLIFVVIIYYFIRYFNVT